MKHQFDTTIKNETSVHAHHPKEMAHLYSAYDGGTIELEFGQLLESLIVSWKPKNILETGTWLGHGARFLANACRKNGFGNVTTIEMREDLVINARKELADFPEVKIIHSESMAWLHAYQGPPFDFAVLDSDLMVRIEELRFLRSRKLLNGLAFVHDSSRWRAAGGQADAPQYPAALDSLGIPYIECPFSRGFRIFQL